MKTQDSRNEDTEAILLREFITLSPHPVNISKEDYLHLVYGESVLLVTENLTPKHTQALRRKREGWDSITKDPMAWFWPLPMRPNGGLITCFVNHHSANVGKWSHALVCLSPNVDLALLHKVVKNRLLPLTSITAIQGSGFQLLLKIDASSREEWEYKVSDLWQGMIDFGLPAEEIHFQSMAALPSSKADRVCGLIYLNPALGIT